MTKSPPPDPDDDRLTILSAIWVVIEQAKGVLIATYRCGPDEALDFCAGDRRPAA